MSSLFLLPTFIALFFVIRRRVDTALLWVYLPCLLLLPEIYHFQIPHLPKLSAAEGVLIPVGAVAFFRWLRGPFKRMDLWVVMFAVSIALSEFFREPSRVDGVLYAIIHIDAIFCSYLIGRKLIEPELRLRVVKQIVILVLCQLPILLWEARMGVNLYDVSAQRIFKIYDFGWFVQIRGGHARISGAFSDAELAGIAFAVCFVLNIWLIKINRADLRHNQPPRLGGFFSKLERYWIPGWMLLGFLALTRSRGPALGLAAGLLVLQIGRFDKRRRLAMAAGAVLLLAGAIAAYSYFSSYASGPLESEEQGSAAYRFALLQNYKPLLEQGGWLGWGYIFHPVPAGQRSVDNEYLLVHVSYGRLGMIFFCLIVAESLWHQCICVWRLRNRDDFLFALSLLASLTIIWITIATVYLGEQLPQIAFLLIGWGQSLTAGETEELVSTPAEALQQRQSVRVFS